MRRRYQSFAQFIGIYLQGSYALCEKLKAQSGYFFGRLHNGGCRADKAKAPAREEAGASNIQIADQRFEPLAGDGCTGNIADFAAIDTQVMQFARGHAAQFGDRLTVLAPVVERACYVHDDPLSSGIRS